MSTDTLTPTRGPQEVHSSQHETFDPGSAPDTQSENAGFIHNALDNQSEPRDTEVHRNVYSRQLRRNIKTMDKYFDGALGRVADTGTKSAYLEAKYQEYADIMQAHGAAVNPRNQRSAERDTIRSLIQLDVLADRKGLTGEEREQYKDKLVDTFHTYVQLDDEKRAIFGSTLDTRYATAAELTRIEREQATVGKKEKGHNSNRLTAALGSVAGVLAGLRGKGHKEGLHKKGVQDASIDENADKTAQPDHTRKQEVRGGRHKKTRLSEHIASANARRLTNRQMKRWDEEQRLAAMSDDERKEYLAERREKQNNRKVFAVLGGVALISTAAYLARYGFDNPFNGIDNGAGLSAQEVEPGTTIGPDHLDDRGSWLSEPFDTLSDSLNDAVEKAQDAAERTETGGGGGGGEGGDRPALNELFDGKAGDRHLTSENAKDLREFLDTYRVKDSDDKGVWGIAETYLKSQGVNNPSVYEIDSVKDYILENSRLNEKSIIYPGDTIKLRK